MQVWIHAGSEEDQKMKRYIHRNFHLPDNHDMEPEHTQHPIPVKYAGTATILPWNSHIHYAGTANASPAIPTSAIKNALEQP